MAHGDPILYSLYIYAPNKIAPIIFAVLYGISGGVYIWQCHRYRAIKLIGLHLVCAVLFAVGYALREYGAYNYLYKTDDEGPLIMFILSQVFIYVCPPLLELANYHTLGRVFHYVPYHAPIPPGKVLHIFGGLMAVVEILNSLGVSLAANATSSASQQALGGRMTIAAISIQLILISVFLCIAGVFHARCARAKLDVQSVKVLLFTLYGSMVLILARCIYRLVEHTAPTKKDLTNIDALRKLSPVIRHEVYFYIFEATLMLVNSILWNVCNPGRLLPRDYHFYLARDGSQTEGARDIDERPLLLKSAHILTFGLLFGRKRIDRSQELSPYPDTGPK